MNKEVIKQLEEERDKIFSRKGSGLSRGCGKTEIIFAYDMLCLSYQFAIEECRKVTKVMSYEEAKSIIINFLEEYGILYTKVDKQTKETDDNLD